MDSPRAPKITWPTLSSGESATAASERRSYHDVEVTSVIKAASPEPPHPVVAKPRRISSFGRLFTFHQLGTPRMWTPRSRWNCARSAGYGWSSRDTLVVQSLWISVAGCFNCLLAVDQVGYDGCNNHFATGDAGKL